MTNSLQNIILADPHSNARAEILVGFGFNCHRLRLDCDKRSVEVLRSSPEFSTQAGNPTGSGLPIMFPFPGRIRGTEMRWKNKAYPLPAGDGQGNAIHGFVLDRPWRITSQAPQRIVGEFQAGRDAPELLRQWPSDFCISADYELTKNRFQMIYRVSNPGSKSLPCGLGIHPYFRLPLGPLGSAEDCTIRLPGTSTWELDQLITTGRKHRLPNADEFLAGQRFRQLHVDCVLSDLQFKGPTGTAEIIDEQNHCRMTIEFDQTFRECIVYTPGDRGAICIEPITCVPDPFRLADEGIDTGLLVLEPQQSFEYRISLGLYAHPTSN